ncbi:hypothetical protein [Roseisolibacter agri]|uniref:Uncharacterized protein n=1 Tax=Roseisolibacter agri TaxID=2014610 RepID=A0AA37V4Q4_9BACT|nr:hypothetical protein [Roseisolibacter agri]GLC28242.1 hypothetical protein rosag_47550 [Roseisolibacter agri]
MAAAHLRRFAPARSSTRPIRHAVAAATAVLTTLIAGTTGCALRPTGYRVNDHAVFVHPDGRALQGLDPATAAGRGRPAGRPLGDTAYRAQLRVLMDSIRASPHDAILVFVHGGLVSHKGGYEHAEQLGPAMDSAGYYPVFLNWNASAGSTLRSHLFRMRQGEDDGPILGLLTAPFVIVADLGRTVARAPLGWLHQSGDYCRTLTRRLKREANARLPGNQFCPIPGIDKFRRAERAKEERLVAEAQARVALGPAAAGVPPDPLEIGLGDYNLTVGQTVARDLTGVVTFVPKLVVGPVVDGFGTGAWAEMRRRTQTMFRAPVELQATPRAARRYRQPTGAAYVLFDSLAALIAAQGADSVPPARRRARRLVLVGHSMGVIALNRVLQAFPALPVDTIRYMAAAASVAEVEAAVVPFLERHPRTVFFHGMLHPYADAGEWQPKYLDVVPRGSLLEWIDDYLTAPETPLDRTAGKWPNLILAEHVFPAAVRDRVVLKAFGVRDTLDRGSRVFRRPARHGDFSDRRIAFWSDSAWALARPAALWTR